MAKAPILFYDTTLRDGTQGEGISFSVASKLRVAEKLDQFRIDYIEGGWPGSNPRDRDFFEAARGLKLKHARIAAFGSTCRVGGQAADDAQLRVLLEAETPVITIFGKSWLLHVTEVLRTTPEENLRIIESSVAFLVAQGREVIYDAEHFYDGFADNPDYALATLAAAARGGASCLTLCDTNGGQLVSQVAAATRSVVATFPALRIGVHCHNDAGLGVAVSLAGVEAGATLVQGTMNGFGERTGNANLTTIIPNVCLKLGHDSPCQSSLAKLRDLSVFVDEMANQRPDLKAPYVGASAFAHKGGVHANAAAKVARSYEHIEPAEVGNRQRILVSDMSGRSSLILKARELGMQLDEKSPELKQLLEELKELENRGYEFEAADASFQLLIHRFLDRRQIFFSTISYRVMVERDAATGETVSEATVKIRVGDTIHHTVAESNGPVGALDHALRQALQRDFPEVQEVRLSDFKVRILESSQGADARIRVQVESTDGHELWGTVGASDNIIDASWEALQDSLEYFLERRRGNGR